ncbi:MAG: DUF4412 domain-containing protein [Bacteroidetes bacterium]|nr:DUF4412 domain-containing protein [Bacteroidota bacterium]MBV6460763.1 hypothetical protein [Flavobacteriales bacterium]WKZ75759.1 MAG: DUF4412 domain-containing protein [Vicingaceae bacterium]MCL4817303.1 DUF4412 domain-containing protein [Flavobacteriales bacterium]NOG94721.1 DUF4412 domain-containing protein [Bacteroidota bacterium]
MRLLKTTLFTLLILFSTIVLSQKKSDFEGTIKFRIDYTEMDETFAAYASMMPKDFIIKIKGENSRMEQNMGMAGSTVVITNKKSKQVITLMDIMGSKYKMLSPIENNETKEDANDYSIVYLNETKQIAGYTCKKAEVHSKTSGEVLTLFYTEELTSDYLPNKPKEYETLKGFPMEYEIAQETMRMTVTVNEIKKEKLSSAEFEAPADYKEVTQEELMKMYGGGR